MYGYGPGPQYGPPPKKKKRLWLWVAIVVVVLLVAGGAAAAYFLLLKGDKKAAPDEPVQQFYQALVDGDAAAALALLDTKPASTTMLTNSVVAASQKQAPIKDITTTVESSSAEEATVAVSYTMGGKAVDQTVTVRKVDNVWKVVGGTATVDLTDIGTGSLPLALNGAVLTAPQPPAEEEDDTKAEPLEVVLFPGSYTLTTTTRYVTLSDATFVVTDPGSAQVGPVTATLTDEGAAAVTKVVRESFDACVATKTFHMDCAGVFQMTPTLSDGTELVEGTVERTATPETLAWLDETEPTLGTDPAIAEIKRPEGIVGVRVYVHGILNGREIEGEIDATYPVANPVVDLSDPDNLTVSWGH